MTATKTKAPRFSLSVLWARMFRSDQTLSKKEVHCRAMFTAVSGIDADHFLESVTQGLPDVQSVHMKTPHDHFDMFRVIYKGKGYQDWYDIDFRPRVVEAGVLRNRRGDRSTGRRMFGLRLVGAAKLGFARLHLTPMLETGGYVWAKAGVYVEETSQKRKFQETMADRLKTVKDRLSPTVYARACDLIRLLHPGDLNAIAGLSTVLEDIAPQWNYIQRRSSAVPRLFKEYRKMGFVRGTSMTLGQFLLYDTCYHAYVDLKDDRQMAMLERYTGVSIRACAKGVKPFAAQNTIA